MVPVCLPTTKTDIQQTHQKISQLKQQISQSNNTVSNLPTVKKELVELQSEYDSLSTTIPTKDFISTMTNRLVDLGKAQELDILSIQPDLDALLESNDYFVKVPIAIELEGTYTRVGNFIESLDTLSFNFQVSEMVVEREEKKPLLTVNLSSYVYVVNPNGQDF